MKLGTSSKMHKTSVRRSKTPQNKTLVCVQGLCCSCSISSACVWLVRFFHRGDVLTFPKAFPLLRFPRIITFQTFPLVTLKMSRLVPLAPGVHPSAVWPFFKLGGFLTMLQKTQIKVPIVRADMLLIGIQVNTTPPCRCLCVVTSLHQRWSGFCSLVHPALYFASPPTASDS